MTNKREFIDAHGDYVRELERARIDADAARWEKNRKLQAKAVRTYRRTKAITKNTPKSCDIE